MLLGNFRFELDNRLRGGGAVHEALFVGLNFLSGRLFEVLLAERGLRVPTARRVAPTRPP